MRNKDKNKKIYEKRCIYFLKEYFGEKFKNFFEYEEPKESPDFWNEIDNIGIECVEALDYKTGREIGFYRNIPLNSTKEEIDIISNNKYSGDYKANLQYTNDKFCSYNITDMISNDSSLIIAAIDKKLKKIKTYKNFNENILLIISVLTICSPKDIESKLINEIKELENIYKAKFNKYIVVNPKSPKTDVFEICSDTGIKYYQFDYPYEIETMKFSDKFWSKTN